jgi:hypothetical protein
MPMTTRVRPFPLCLLACALAACGPSPRASEPASDAPERRLRVSGGDLFVTAPADSYPRGAILYVLDAKPIYGQTRVRIGLVQVVEPKPAKVAWYCRPRRPVDGPLRAEGLPVEPFTPDTTLRAGKCWGRHTGEDEGSWDEARGVLDLELNLGEGDGVRSGDLFELLGAPIVDEANRMVVGFERIGQCAVQPHESSIATSVCRLDRASWPEFGRQAWIRGGFVHLTDDAPL